MSDLSQFVFERVADDKRRDDRRMVLRGYHRRFTASRESAATTATRWLNNPADKHAGEMWLRGIAKHYRHHPDYQQEWKP